MQSLTLPEPGNAVTIDVLEEQFSANGLQDYGVDTDGECLAEGEEVVYAFTAAVNATVTFETASQTDTVLALLEATCSEGAAATAVCDDDGGDVRNSLLTAAVTAGTNYFLVYDHFSERRDVGSLTITVAP